MTAPDPTAGEREPSPSTLWPHGPIVGHPKHDYYVCGSCHGPLGPGPCPAKMPTQPNPPTFDSLLSDPTQQLDSEGVVIASIPAPDPTAGKHVAGCHRYSGVWLCDPACPRDPRRREPRPAVAAPTGTSEDVEALAKVILAERLAARELPNTYMDDAELVESMKPRARAVLASDWLAAREAAARAEERERIAAAIEADADTNRQIGMFEVKGLRAAARIAREVRP